MFDRPKDIEHLLRNLKLAMVKDLLLQPGFYSDENLLKFFNGAQVTWSTPTPHMNNMTWKLFKVAIDRNVFPEMTVELLRSCKLTPAYASSSGPVPARISAAASVEIPVDAVPGFTVNVVRSVLGAESTTAIDNGQGTDGGHYTPESKGSLVYEDTAKETYAQSQIERSSITFFVKLDSPAALAAGIAATPSGQHGTFSNLPTLTIYLDPTWFSLGVDTLTVVLAHELGHTLGEFSLPSSGCSGRYADNRNLRDQRD